MENGLFIFILFSYYLLKVQCRLLNSGRTGRTSSISAQKSNPGLHCLPLVRLLVVVNLETYLYLFNFIINFILSSWSQLWLSFLSFIVRSIYFYKKLCFHVLCSQIYICLVYVHLCYIQPFKYICFWLKIYTCGSTCAVFLGQLIHSKLMCIFQLITWWQI